MQYWCSFGLEGVLVILVLLVLNESRLRASSEQFCLPVLMVCVAHIGREGVFIVFFGGLLTIAARNSFYNQAIFLQIATFQECC